MRQVKASKTKLDVSEQIFDATDRLMAKEGLHHLSMHKLVSQGSRHRSGCDLSLF